MVKKIGLFIFLVIPLFFSVSGQKKDTLRVIPEPVYRNVIKLNPTPMMLWDKRNVTFSYERVLSPQQSITVGAGYLVFGSLIDDTIANIATIIDRQKQGINLSFEYRFYMTKRNSRPIPDGLFLAPFFSLYRYQFNNSLNIINTPEEDPAHLTGDFFAINLGGALGYQFVLWKRMTIDLIMIGPATSYYGGRLHFKGNLNLEEIKEINEDFYDKLVEKYPGVDNVLVDKTFVQKSKFDLFSVGYRYLVQIGFCF